MGAGGMIGGAVDPAKVSERGAISPLETAARFDPEVQMATLDDAKLQIANSPDLFSATEAQDKMAQLDAAKQAMMQRLKMGGGYGS
jgi:hypothetical protein